MWFPIKRLNSLRWRVAWLGASLLPATIAAGLHYALGRVTFIEVIVLAWLMPLALYDLAYHEVPHIAFAVVPCLAGMIYVAWQGDWTLAVIAAVVIAASERHHLPLKLLRRMVVIMAGLASLGLILATDPNVIAGALLVTCFWFAYEMGRWGGADALAAITLALLWPDLRFVLLFAIAHLALAVVFRPGLVKQLAATPGSAFQKLLTLRPISPDELERVGNPGLPPLVLTVVLLVIWESVSPFVFGS